MRVKPSGNYSRREFLDKSVRGGLGAIALGYLGKTLPAYAQSSSASGTINFSLPDGTPWNVIPEGFSEGFSSLVYRINGSGLYPLVVRGNGALETGYITITQDNAPGRKVILPHAAIGDGYASSILLVDGPDGVAANLGFIRNGYGVSVDGVEPSTSFKAPLVYNNLWNTGIALHNPSSRRANLEMILRLSTGDEYKRFMMEIEPGEQSAKFIDQITSISNITGSIDLKSDVPITALGLLMNNQNATFIGLKGVGKPLERSILYLPHIAIGSGYDAGLFLLNAGNEMESGVINFKFRDGSPWAVQPDGYSKAESSIKYNGLRPGAMLPLTIKGGALLLDGYAEIVPDGSFTRIEPTLFYLNNGAGVTVQAAEVGRTIMIPVHNTPDLSTGFALLNTDRTKPLNLETKLTDYRTGATRSNPLILMPGEKKVMYADQLYNDLGNVIGVLEVSSRDGEAAGMNLDQIMSNPVPSFMSRKPVVVRNPTHRVIVRLHAIYPIENLLDGLSTATLTNSERTYRQQTTNGTVTFENVIEGRYKIGSTNVKNGREQVYSEYTLVRRSINGNNIALGDIRGQAEVLIDGDKIFDSISPNNITGEKSYDGRYTLTKNDVSWILAHPGIGGITYKFNDPKNIFESYFKHQSVINATDAVVKRRRLEIFDYLKFISKERLIVQPHEGVPLPDSNTFESLLVNDGGYHWEDTRRDGTILRAGVGLIPESQIGRPMPLQLMLSEYLQAFYALSDPIDTLPGQSQPGLQEVIFRNLFPDGRLEFSLAGNVIVNWAIETPKAFKMR